VFFIMLSTKLLLASAAALATLSGFANAQTNITENDCASSSDFSKCNRDVADKWSSCARDCRGDGNCIVNCNCDSHQKYINCMAESCWNQVRAHYPPLPSQRANCKLIYFPRSTLASINSLSSSTSPSAQKHKSQSHSGQHQTMPRIDAPATLAKCYKRPYPRAMIKSNA
jgi:hypothetical protein